MTGGSVTPFSSAPGGAGIKFLPCATLFVRPAVFTFWKNGLGQGVGMIAQSIEHPPAPEAGRGRRWHLAAAMGSLVGAESEEDVAAALLAHGRAISGADGIAVARREGDEIHYIGEDSIAPLWAGRRFPA